MTLRKITGRIIHVRWRTREELSGQGYFLWRKHHWIIGFGW